MSIGGNISVKVPDFELPRVLYLYYTEERKVGGDSKMRPVRGQTVKEELKDFELDFNQMSILTYLDVRVVVCYFFLRCYFLTLLRVVVVRFFKGLYRIQVT